MIKKPQIPVIDHPVYSELIMNLHSSNLNSYNLADVLNKARSGIELQLIYLKKNDWIKKLKKKDKSSPVNYEKLVLEFSEYVLKKIRCSNKYIEINLLVKEKFLQNLLKNCFEYYISKNDKEKENITIKTIFKEIIDDFKVLLIQETNTNANKTSINDFFVVMKKRYLQTYILFNALREQIEQDADKENLWMRWFLTGLKNGA